ncbi:SlyX family protein [Aureimonas mangrovi]|uniref:SlyX family protein n=1 Tax=Aureimonas mangrovi TaxID=2758041 RepID=UPI00163D9075|nr:SlyX family protein [Aureimonas mangrovi]
MSGADAEGRIVELEAAIAHQGVAIEELSDEVRRQGQVIDRLEKTLRELAERFLALEDVATPRPEITKPPHY